MFLSKIHRATPYSIFFRRPYSSAQLNLYQVLDLSPGASLKDIKLQFKRLSKMYHPDLNAHLSAEDQEANSKKFVDMVSAYDTLKDKNKRKSYDATLSSRSSSSSSMYSRRQDHSDNEYYGEARNYSRARASGSYTASGYNFSRNHVYNAYKGQNPASGSGHFTGEHRNRGDRFDVPHFNYNEHLAKQLKFEQRMIAKDLSEADIEAVLRQLAPDGDLTKVSEELLTKHLMRQAKRGNFAKRDAHAYKPTATRHPYMYQGPQNGQYAAAESGGAFKAFMLAGGAGSAYLLYNLF